MLSIYSNNAGITLSLDLNSPYTAESKITDYVVVDIETTGFNKKTDRIIELAAIKVVNFEIVDTFVSLVNPLRHIPTDATAVNGITDEMVNESPIIGEIIRKFIDFIGNNVLIGQNINDFDIPFINVELERNGLDKIDNYFIDTLIIARNELTLSSNRLEDLCDFYGIHNEEAHRAFSDVIATNEVYKNMYKNLETVPIKYSAEKQTGKRSHKSPYSAVTRDIQLLEGYIDGILCDGVLNEDEINHLRSWITQHEVLSGDYIYNAVKKSLDLYNNHGSADVLFSDLRGIFSPQYTQYIKPKNEIDFNDKSVCISGEFKDKTRAEVISYIEENGGTVKNNVTKSLDILLIGDYGSDKWKNCNQGGKIILAKQYNEKGANIEIIQESAVFG